jgi:hypothetical protein
MIFITNLTSVLITRLYIACSLQINRDLHYTVAMKFATVFGLLLAGFVSSVSSFGGLPFHIHQSAGGHGSRFALYAVVDDTVGDIIKPMIQCKTSQRLGVIFYIIHHGRR